MLLAQWDIYEWGTVVGILATTSVGLRYIIKGALHAAAIDRTTTKNKLRLERQSDVFIEHGKLLVEGSERISETVDALKALSKDIHRHEDPCDKDREILFATTKDHAGLIKTNTEEIEKVKESVEKIHVKIQPD